MRIDLAAISLAAVLAAACTTTAPATPIPPDAAVANGCNIAPVQSMVGQVATEASTEQARAAAGAASLRVLAPGDAATMDFRGDRLNIFVDAGRTILKFSCG